MKAKNKLILGLIILVSAVLRFWRLGARGLWKDEIFSTLEAQQSIVDIFTKKSYFYGYTPTHHFFTHLALYFGKNEFLVRFPAVLFGIATIYLIYRLGELLFDRKVGLVSAFLLSVSPLHLGYSREVRYYSYLVFFSALTTFFLFRALKERRKRWLILFLLATLLNIMTQPIALLVLGAEVLFATIWSVACLTKWVAGKRRVFKTVRSLRMGELRKKENLLIVGGFLVLVLLIGVFIRSFGELLSMVKLKPAGPPKDLVFLLLKDLSGDTPLLFFCLFFFLAGGWLGLKENKKLAILFLFLLFVLPPAVLYFLRPGGFGFLIRYVIFIIIPYFLLVSLGIVSLLKRDWLIILAVLLFALLSVEPIGAYYQTKRGDWRGVGEYLEANVKPGDVVITESEHNKLLLDYYWDAEEKEAISKTAAESLPSEMMRFPFKRYLHQHDYVSPGGLANPEGISLVDFEEVISFDPNAVISLMYLFVSRPVWAWWEAEEEPVVNQGWEISELWGQTTAGADALREPEAVISYQVSVPRDGDYDLYTNLRWDGARGILKYKIDDGEWSEGFQPSWGEFGDVFHFRWKERKLGSLYLTKGEYLLSFLSLQAEDGGRFQTIDYFYLTLSE